MIQITAIKRALLRLGVRLPDLAVTRDADELVRIWGEAAYTVAANLSWREDVGLIHAADAGHWTRVKREIGQRRGWHDDGPEADFAAGLDRLRLDA